MNIESWIPKRMIFYPDGHRRWAETQLNTVASCEEVEEKRFESYRKGATTCINVIDAFANAGGEGVDVFLTRPSTYVTDVQGRTSSSIMAIHDVIRTDLVEILADRQVGTEGVKKVRLDSYTRADLPRDATPPTLLNDQAQIVSWEKLTDAIKQVRRPMDKNDFSVNLLINYDGHIENSIIDNLLQSTDMNQERASELRNRLLPMSPTYDMWLRTAPETKTSASFRMSCGPTRPLAETSLIIIPKFSPDVTPADIRHAINKVVSFRRNNKHVVQPIIEGEI